MKYYTEREFNRELSKIKKRNAQIELHRQLLDEKRKGDILRFDKMKTSNKVLFASVTAIILFTIACMFIQYKTSMEVSSTLITLWFSFWTVEIVSLTSIKVTKVIKDYKSDSPDDDENTGEVG